MDLVKRFFRDEKGQGMAEYGLILALVAVAVIAVLGLLGDELVNIFNSVIDGLAGD
ncbi:MAG TPA: Flp family type IVb pilin [Syntrophaceticus sp.]|nr:Flp family type IVb pilin [Syntrophaceticus sp.]